MDDLLKNAIADAKAVRETALVNAKLALEEAFTPKIQSMLSKKIQSETEGEAEEGEEIPAEEEEVPAEEDEEAEEMYADEEEVPAEEEEEMESEEEPAVDGGGEEGEKDVAVDVGDDDDDDDDDDEAEAEEGEYEEDLDLEAIIRELEGEEAEEGEEEMAEEEEAEEEEEIDEQSDSSEIGSGDNKVNVADSGDEEDPQGAGVKSDSMDETLDIELSEEEEAEEGEDVEENIDLEEILKSLSEEEEAEEGEEVEEVTQLKSDLGEHRKVIKFLRSKLNEVNLLNAKLLFTNKLFKAFNLNNDEKMKVVETFDRANNLREVKLVYSTLAESYGYAGGVSRIPKVKISEGSASKPIASTKPSKKVISEGNDLANRFKKLAGLND